MACKTKVTLTTAAREKIKKENAKQVREVRERMVKRTQKKEESGRKGEEKER